MKTVGRSQRIARGNRLVLQTLAAALKKSGYKFRYEDTTGASPCLRAKRLLGR